jgi:hypothetical protein
LPEPARHVANGVKFEKKSKKESSRCRHGSAHDGSFHLYCDLAYRPRGFTDLEAHTGTARVGRHTTVGQGQEGKAMTQDRYFHWMRVWKWFATTHSAERLWQLHSLIDGLWQEERKQSTPRELAAYAEAWALEDADFVNDPDYQAYKREMDRALGEEPS